MNHEEILISVIIPVYNGEKFLIQALENIQRQNYFPLEIILVDDGSTDKTSEIAAQFSESIRYLYQPNQVPSAARNYGIKMAKGEALTFLDVDDLWAENTLQLLVNYLKNYPLVEIVQGLIQDVQLCPVDSDTNSQEWIEKNTWFPYNFINLGSAVYRKSAFKKVGLFDETLNYSEDSDWFIRAWEERINKVVLDDVTLFYRQHQQNMTLGLNLIERGFVKVFKRHLDRCRKAGKIPNSQPENYPTLAEYTGKKADNLIQNADFTIISNDCWGTMLYKALGLSYQTPLINTQIFATCYLELLKDLRKYLESSLVFTNISRYEFVNQSRQEKFYPVGLLGGKVEIHFLYDSDEELVLANWNKRCQRINWSNLFIEFSLYSETNQEQILKEFEQLDYPHKICFTLQAFPDFKSTILIPELMKNGAKMFPISNKYFDVIRWLNHK